MLEELLQDSGELGWALAIYALAVPVELAFGTGHRVAWSERAGNIGAMLFNFLVGGALLLALLGSGVGERILAYPYEPRWALLENPIAYALVAVFLVDGLFYVYHRLQHSVGFLWRIHQLHHTDPAVNITTSRRAHFLERPLQFLVLVAPVLWLLGLNTEAVVYLAVFGPFFLFFAHLDVRLPLGPLTPVFVGPSYHRVHHDRRPANQRSNFAQAFPLFDIIGGTYHAPDLSKPPETGVEGRESARARWLPILG